MALELDFTGKTILVNGVHKGGMGGATCRLLAKGGATVIALDNQQSYVDGIAEQVRELGATCHTMLADLTNMAEVEKVIPRVLAEHGMIDGIANVAGGTRAEDWMPLDHTPLETWRNTFAINCDYIFILARDIAKAWIEAGRGGSIVSVGSISAKDSAPWHGPYGAAKSGLIALHRTMAYEWHEFGIRANTVSPGAVPSERLGDKAERMSAAAKASRDPAVPVVFTQPEELGKGIVFLLSDMASGISGQNLTVDNALSTRFSGGLRRSRKAMMAAGEI